MDALSLIFLTIALFYIMFMRTCNNALIAIFRNKDYVVVHLRKTGNRKAITHYIIPNAKDNFLTKVPLGAKRRYELRPADFNYLENNRKHYIVNEEDAMVKKFRAIEIKDDEVVYRYKGKLYFSTDDEGKPLKLDKRTDEDYVLASKRVDGAMSAKSYRVIHEETNPIILYIAIIGFVIIIAVAGYGVMQYQELSPLVHAIYEGTVVAKQTVSIAPMPTPTPIPGR